jgi:acyl-CoA reductase-like NAD-dependent aldehyde dehydrogenase
MATIESAAATTTAIAFTPTGVITGRVADAQGNPVSRAFVRAASGKVSYEGQTNDLGEYRIFDLPPSQYVVNAAPYLAPRIEGTTLIRPSPPSVYAPGEGQAMLFLTRMLQAGVPPDALHFVPGDGAEVGGALTRDPRLAGVVFTGSTDTARLIERSMAARAGGIGTLIAETGGLNVMLADSSALAEQLVLDVVQSGFNSAGQRCSALRILLVEEEIAPRVKTLLAGCMDELVIGDPARLGERDVSSVD